MKKYYCNPINFNYQYQFNQKGDKFTLNREAADPSMILFKGKYYLFPSMTRGFLVSEDMASWKLCPLEGLPVYDYAPDVRAVGDWMYFCASRRGEICDFYRTKDPEGGVFERIPGTFDFWDPNLFLDDDGRLYFYWGCSNFTPIWGVELNPDTMERIGEPVALIGNCKGVHGFERTGENHVYDPDKNDALQLLKEHMAKMTGCDPKEIQDVTPAIQALPEELRPMLEAAISDDPYIEGAWMTKYQNRYYLQYACPGAEYNVYSDGVYVGDSPLGPFTACEGNPYSYSPGGFCPGAGHGSTMEDIPGNWWHTSTSRISVTHKFERRIGIWPAGFDQDGELFCNQRYGDWPRCVTGEKQDPWALPEWMLLSYGKAVTASSREIPVGEAGDAATAAESVGEAVSASESGGHAAAAAGNREYAAPVAGKQESAAPIAGNRDRAATVAWNRESAASATGNQGEAAVVDENIQIWWKAAAEDARPWVQVDLGQPCQVNAVQINFADDMGLVDRLPQGAQLAGETGMERYIEERRFRTCWLLEASGDGEKWFVLEDKRKAETDLPHDLAVIQEGITARYIRLTITATPYDAPACISGLRVFGKGKGSAPARTARVKALRSEDRLSMQVGWQGDAVGYEVLWGHRPDKLYHSCRMFARTQLEIRALMANTQRYYVRVDAFNENGITEGEVVCVENRA